jgi:hypothetical protein
MTFHFLNDVFLLDLALETAESIFEGFALLKSYFSQTNYTPKLVPLGRDSYCKVLRASQELCQVSVQKKWEIWGELNGGWRSHEVIRDWGSGCRLTVPNVQG